MIAPRFFAGLLVSGVLAARATSRAQPDPNHPQSDYVLTTNIAGFYIGVTDEMGYTNTEAGKRVCFAVWTTGQPTYVVLPSDAAYAYQVNLFSTNGLPVAKTSDGREIGSRFLEWDTKPRLRPLKLWKQWTAARDEKAPQVTIGRPAELFKIDKPGPYNLQLRFQIIAYIPASVPGQYTYRLIRFPPVDYWIHKDPPPKSK